MKAVQVQLTEKQVKRLYEIKNETGCSIGSQVRMALIKQWRELDGF